MAVAGDRVIKFEYTLVDRSYTDASRVIINYRVHAALRIRFPRFVRRSTKTSAREKVPAAR